MYEQPLFIAYSFCGSYGQERGSEDSVSTFIHQDPKSTFLTPYAVLPDGAGGWTPCPTLLTEAEAIRYLRLDLLGRKGPNKTLQYYRERGLIKATRISNVNMYLRESLDEFLATMTARTYQRKGQKV